LIGRILQTETGGANIFNRGLLFTTWTDLLSRMPWYGFGGEAQSVLQGAFTYFTVFWPHSLYFYFALVAGWPGLIAVAAFVLVLGYQALVKAPGEGFRVHRRIVLGSTVLFWAISEAKVEFVRLPFYGNLIMVLFGIIAADRWLALRLPEASGAAAREASAPGHAP
jgi:hypothetical protein